STYAPYLSFAAYHVTPKGHRVDEPLILFGVGARLQLYPRRATPAGATLATAGPRRRARRHGARVRTRRGLPRVLDPHRLRLHPRLGRRGLPRGGARLLRPPVHEARGRVRRASMRPPARAGCRGPAGAPERRAERRHEGVRRGDPGRRI